MMNEQIILNWFLIISIFLILIGDVIIENRLNKLIKEVRRR